MKELKSRGVPPTRIESIGGYLKSAKTILRAAQKAIDNPSAKNFDTVVKHYELWVYEIYKFLQEVDSKKAKSFLGKDDGVRTLLNLFDERINNANPRVFYEQGEHSLKVDEGGVRILQNLTISLREKMAFLEQLQQEITHSILPNKPTKKAVIVIHKTGKVGVGTKPPLSGSKNSHITQIIYQLREADGIKLASLAKMFGAEKTNISRDIRSFNDRAKAHFGLKEDVIVRDNGFRMNNKYNFFYEDIGLV